MEKTLILLRGLPGSGKSTVAKLIARALTTASLSYVICSADSYFVGEDGVCRFDPRKLGAAHNKCRADAGEAMLANINYVIVDNTNITKREMQPYEELANEFGYTIKYQTVGNLTDIDIYAKRCIHNVPLKTIERMAKRFENPPQEEIVTLRKSEVKELVKRLEGVHELLNKHLG